MEHQGHLMEVIKLNWMDKLRTQLHTLLRMELSLTFFIPLLASMLLSFTRWC